MREQNIVNYNKLVFGKALKKYGDSPKSCLWDKRVVFRYDELTKIGDLNNAEILDIGCGTGEFYEYCTVDKGYSIKYKGIDLVEGMIELARSKYPEAEFETQNILESKIDKVYDYIVFCGVFNLSVMNDEYMMKMLEEAFQYCKRGMAFNFISTYVNFHEEEMAYHNPAEILKLCIEKLSFKVKMNHHYNKCDVSVFVYK